MARFAPASDSTVRSINSSRACTSTWMRHILRDAVLLDEPAHELELGVRGGGKADLDFLEPAFHQRVEELAAFARHSWARPAPGCRRGDPRCTRWGHASGCGWAIAGPAKGRAEKGGICCWDSKSWIWKLREWWNSFLERSSGGSSLHPGTIAADNLCQESSASDPARQGGRPGERHKSAGRDGETWEGERKPLPRAGFNPGLLRPKGMDVPFRRVLFEAGGDPMTPLLPS